MSEISEFLNQHFLGLKLWQYLILLVFIIGGWICFKFISWVLRKILTKICRKLKFSNIFIDYLRNLVKPLSAVAVIGSIRIALPHFELPKLLYEWIEYIINGLIPLALTILGYQLIDVFSAIFSGISKHKETTLGDVLVPFLKKIIKIIVVVFGGIYILQSLNVNITPLLAGVSLGGLAFAFAAQDMLRNFFGSITIFTDRPFSLGDWISFEGKEGTVEDIGIRTTRVRSFGDTLITIPNGKLADMTIENLSIRTKRKFKSEIFISSQNNSERILNFEDKIRERISGKNYVEINSLQVFLNDISEAYFKINIVCFVIVSNSKEENLRREELIFDVIKLSEEMGIELFSK